MSDERERAAFEDWADSQWPGAKRQQLKCDNYGEYLNCIYRDMWRGWQARASLPVGVPDGLATALFNALEAYEATRDSFPALKDKAIHTEQCEMLRQYASQLLAAPSAPAGEAVPVAGDKRWKCEQCGAGSGEACNVNGCFANERSADEARALLSRNGNGGE